MLAVGTTRIFLRSGRNCRHAAMLALAAQPTEKGAHEQLRIDPVGLGAPMLTRNRDAARMDDVGLDLPLPQPTRQPKAVPASLEGNDDPADRLANFYRLIAPTVQKVQKRIFIRLQLLQRIPGDAGYQPGNNPPLQTQFDYGHKMLSWSKATRDLLRSFLRMGAPFGW